MIITYSKKGQTNSNMQHLLVYNRFKIYYIKNSQTMFIGRYMGYGLTFECLDTALMLSIYSRGSVCQNINSGDF